MTDQSPYEAFRAQAAQDVRDAMNEHRAFEWAERAVDAVILRYVTSFLPSKKVQTNEGAEAQDPAGSGNSRRVRSTQRS